MFTSTRSLQVVTSLVILSLLVGVLSLTPNAIGSVTTQQTSQQVAAVAQANDGPLTGNYDGDVTLQKTYNGVYSDTAQAGTAVDLGSFSLSLHIDQSANLASGYIKLDRTMVFTQENIILATPTAQGGTAIEIPAGPLLTGSFDNSKLTLQSQPISTMLNSGRTLTDGRKIPTRTVIRQFRLISDVIDIKTGVIEGEYRETMWGYSSQPTTVIGRFRLIRPVFNPFDPAAPTATPAAPTATPNPSPTNHIYLPIVSR